MIVFFAILLVVTVITNVRRPAKPADGTGIGEANYDARSARVHPSESKLFQTWRDESGIGERFYGPRSWRMHPSETELF